MIHRVDLYINPKPNGGLCHNCLGGEEGIVKGLLGLIRGSGLDWVLPKSVYLR